MVKKIICAIRKKEIAETPEEIVRQNFIKILIEDYNYLNDDIKVEYRTKKHPSDKARSYPVDIAVFENNKPKIFIETKRYDEKPKDGIHQLQNYMRLDNDVIWGAWTNGSDTLFLRRKSEKSISFIDVFDFPKKSFNDVSSQIKKKDLIISNNLQFQFKSIRSYISGSSVGITRDEKITEELIKIVLCKTYDEKFKAENEYLDFYHEANLYEETAKRLNNIYTQVKEKYCEVFKKDDEIKLDAKSISYCVSQLQRYFLTSSDRNVISDAFETIIGHSLKGSQGQFFTPKNIVKLIINVIKPAKNQKVIDPACGSGSFLVESMLYNWNNYNKLRLSELAILEEKKDYALKNLFGIEKDEFLGQICKSYMAVLGDGKSGIFIDNSLENVKNWNNNTIQLGTFDIVLTNPPFGKDIKIDSEISESYCSNKVDIAFLERSIDMLKDGGKLGIVLSEVVFHAPTYKKFRNKFMYAHNITYIIDLPHDTFRPYNNAKCIVLIIEKNIQQQEQIKLIYLKEIGHDHKGSPKYGYDYTENAYTQDILDDTIEVIDAFANNTNSEKIIEVSSQEITKNDVLIPRYYFNHGLFDGIDCIEIQQLIDEGILCSFEGHGSPESHLKGMGEVPYIRVKDICNFEVVTNEIDCIPEENGRLLKRKGQEIQAKDIVMVRRGSYRIGDIGFVYPKDTDSVFTKELQFFRVLRPNKYGITQHNLLLLLNNKAVKEQIKNMTFLDTTLPTLYNRWRKLNLPLFDIETMNSMNDKMEKCYLLRSKFWESLA